METFRLKNIIILILALVNVFLLSSLALRKSSEYAADRRAGEELQQLFEKDGVSLDSALLPSDQPPAGRTLTRSTEQDQSLAAFLLGSGLTVSDEGGGIYAYRSDFGLAQFRSGGSFDVIGKIPQEDLEAFLRRFCKAYGYGDLTVSLKDGSGTAKAVQYCDGLPVVNGTVTFTAEDGVLLSVSGTHIPDTYSAAPDSGTPLSDVAALTAFLKARRDTGAVVSAVTAVSLCYELQSTTSAPMTLVPAWRIGTDTVNYYVNCFTSAVTHD